MNYRTLIVDDEQAACQRLNRMLATLNAPCEIIGEAGNGFDAISMINEAKPDVVFLDIELPGINGIELLRHCIFDPFIIFTTAYDSYAIDAFEAKTVSYLVKPISETRLFAALNKLAKMAHIPAQSLATALQPLLKASEAQPLRLLPVKNGEIISLLKMESIACIKAEGKYTLIMTKEKSYVSNYPITELESRLDSPYFIRIGRGYIVNLHYVVEIRKTGIGKYAVTMDVASDKCIFIGKSYYDELKRRLHIK